jgi:HEAT repeat protein
MKALLAGAPLSLSCGRSGFVLSDGEPLKDATRLSAALSFELFSRRVRRITFLDDLFQEDLLELIRIMTLAPEDVQQAGGMERIMTERGVRTIWLNELDLAAIHGKRLGVEASGIVPPGVDELEQPVVIPPLDGEEAPPWSDERLGPEEALQPLLARLAEAREGGEYPMLVRQALSCASSLVSRNRMQPLLPLVELLSLHADDSGRGVAEHARFGLEQLAGQEALLHFLLDLPADTAGVSQSALGMMLSFAGQSATMRVVEQLAASESRATRKALATLLVRVGEQAVPAITAMMADQPWFVIRNLVAILGNIGSPGALPVLQECLRHDDIRVCKEAIRSLAKIGGGNAETAIIAVLRGNNPLLLPQAIASLGGMRSRRAVGTLMQFVCAEDLFLKNLPLKVDALAAIALIGDSSVVPRLLEMLQRRPLMARNRWTVLKIHVVTCLAGLGEPRALPVLRKLAHASGELGHACNVVIGSMERTGGGSRAGA